MKIKSIIVLGSGALKIGEAGEFDYSGSQALKAISEEGIKTILINPNIATIQTSSGIADKVYFLPITPHFVEKVIEKEKPDGILLAFGGQTALNCGIELFKNGILEKHKVTVLGTQVDTIMDTEDRKLFNKKLSEINVKYIDSLAVDSISKIEDAANSVGYPVIIRAAYALGGLGSGFCNNNKELLATASKSFSVSPQVLVEKSLKGWKEIEYEVIRDSYDNCITVCNMENFDPLGVHTGESIVVAPSQTLNNKESKKLKELSISIARHLGIIGECNIQFALDPQSEDYRVIEVNARLSRSSALASKATGYPLAFVAAKIALGYGLHELTNSITKSTTFFFEPALDYIVCKIPRWDLSKFSRVSKKLGSSMKSVGEVMAIGKTFEEALQKGLRMIGQGRHGLIGNRDISSKNLKQDLTEPTDLRIFVLAQALSEGYDIDTIYELTKIDKWFLYRLKNIIDIGENLKTLTKITQISDELLTRAKQAGFSDFQITRLIYKLYDSSINKHVDNTRNYRKSRNIIPYVKQIDTLAGEYPAKTNYLYLTYHGMEHDVPFNNSKIVVVLGSGAYRIGSSVEFDWCGVNALNTAKNNGYYTIMINYNPETVSTDYDICDRLYFEELNLERVLDIVELENPHGVVLSTGGQIPNNLALKLASFNIPILGTAAKYIDMAEDRHKFSKMLDELDIDQPIWQEMTTIEDIYKFTSKVGLPVLVRPSYVLSGAAMNVCFNKEQLEHFLNLATSVSREHPVVISEFIQSAKEIELDGVAKNGELIAYAISEHIEYAGVHSGDATMQFPPQKLYVETVRRIKKITRKIVNSLKITGPFNIQFLAKDNAIKVIECNLRASRSFPFVSKILKINFIDLAMRAILGLDIKKLERSEFDLDYVGIKAAQFSFLRLHNADPVVGVDMVSTGEVGCIGDDYYEALLKAMLSVGHQIPSSSILVSSGPLSSKLALLGPLKQVAKKGITIFATPGTAEFLASNGVEAKVVYFNEKGTPQVQDYIKTRKIELVINIPKNNEQKEITNGYLLRRTAIDFNIPLITNDMLAVSFIHAFCTLDLKDLLIKSSDEY